MLSLTLRRREVSGTGIAKSQEVAEAVQWEASRTALIVCDMWDKHWCAGASRRVDELAPVMNRVLAAARTQGVLIVTPFVKTNFRLL